MQQITWKTEPMAITREGSCARIEIGCETLVRLLSGRQLQVCELHCLDPESKQLLRRLLLASCTTVPCK